MSIVVEAQSLHKAYGTGTGQVHALAGAGLSVHRGEFVAVTGASGSGKTTLLHCLAGLVAPDRGRVLFDATDLADLDDDERSELRGRRMGFVFQTLNLIPALNVRENVELPLVMRKLPASEVAGRAAAALDQVGLADRPGAFPHELSGGEQQRVAVARAVIADPDIVWADEPTGALDSSAAEGVLGLLKTAVGSGRTVVMVTHDEAVARVADRVLVMRDGRMTA